MKTAQNPSYHKPTIAELQQFKAWGIAALRKVQAEVAKRKNSESEEKTLEEVSVETYNRNLLNRASEKLLESLDATYPVGPVNRWLEKLFEDNRQQGRVFFYSIEPEIDEGAENTYPILAVTCVSTIAFNLEQHLKDKLPFFGWYIGSKNESRPIDNGVMYYVQAYSIEPKFPIENSRVSQFTREVVNRTPNGMFYHAAFAKFANDIERDGLQPNFSNRDDYIYPDRVYLFDNPTSMQQFCAIHMTPKSQNGKLEHTIRTNKRFIGNSTRPGHTPVEADSQYQIPSAGMVYFSVNLKQMLDDGGLVQLYHDNRFGLERTAYFTRNSIPAKYVTRIGSVDIPPALRPQPTPRQPE